jgi:hypothetical protein
MYFHGLSLGHQHEIWSKQHNGKVSSFVGGFPNMFHADHGRGVVCGTILLRDNTAEWRDVLLFTDPR